MRIIWHGHSCFEIKDAVTVVTDPHDGKSIGIKTPLVKADIVLVTHDHFDHNCVRIVKGDPSVVRDPGERFLRGVRIFGLPTFHVREGLALAYTQVDAVQRVDDASLGVEVGV